ncbi:acyltransferase family domain-containing protein [Ditylenchus destructor]|uniref:Acyltransferase family domain-containing protein n=1 Tax=Ditylenchus destructor TaxID=166010 RepID=A0AAD4QYF8_9BILA|nr:acyltransferase family domain-containing protein [Ditylenchus destructor]
MAVVLLHERFAVTARPSTKHPQHFLLSAPLWMKNSLLSPDFRGNIGNVAHKKRREDIQGLRAVAVLAVVLFHLWPKVFRNGYLGVDVFFVISGYLIVSILDKDEQVDVSSICHFYQRRMRRIIPIFLVVTFVTLYCAWFFELLAPDDLHKMCIDSLFSVTFSTNFRDIFFYFDYFEQLNAYRFFLHTWSLSVEIQLYILAPVIFGWLLKSKCRNTIFRYPILISASIILQWNSSRPAAFGFILCRMWEFLAGGLAFYLSVRRNLTRSNGPLYCETMLHTYLHDFSIAIMNCVIFAHMPHLLVALLITVLFLPNMPDDGLFAEVLRAFIVLITAVLIRIWENRKSIPMILTSPLMIELGNLSYIWYLVHWPVVQFVVYWSPEGTLNFADGMSILILTILLSALLDHMVDDRIQRITEFKTVLHIILTLLAFCLVLALPL